MKSNIAGSGNSAVGVFFAFKAGMDNQGLFRLVMAFMVWGSSSGALANAGRSVEERVLAETSVAPVSGDRVATVTLISLAGAGSYLNYDEAAKIAKARAETRVQSLYKSSPEHLHPYMKTTQEMLKDALPGDVVHFEYHVRGVGALRNAERESLTTWNVWEREKTRIKEAIRLARTNEEIDGLNRRLAYAEARRHRAHELYSATRLNRVAAEEGLKHGKEIPGSYVVYREFIVGKGTEFEIFDFFKSTLGYGDAQSIQAKVPHVIVKRTDFANAKVAGKAARSARFGAIGVVVAAGFVIEEVAEGRLSEALAESRSEQETWHKVDVSR